MKRCLPLLSLLTFSAWADPSPVGGSTQPKGLITPPVAPKVQEGMGISLDAAFTWWKAQVSNLPVENLQGKTLSPPASFEPGFQVGVGCELGLDGFDLYAEYTWVHMPWNTSSSSLSGFSTYIIPSPETGTLQAPPLHNLTNSRTFQYNIIDLELGRDFFISKKLTLRPHVGGKLTRMFDKLHLQGNDDTLDLFFSQTLSGIGIRAGVNSVWHLLQKVGLYGNIACTGLWSNFHDRIASIKTTTQTVIPILELELGVNYITWLSQDRYQLYAKAGWEEQVWIGYNHMPVQGISTTSGNLSMQGLTLQIGWAF